MSRDKTLFNSFRQTDSKAKKNQYSATKLGYFFLKFLEKNFSFVTNVLHSYTIPFVLFGSSYSRCFFFSFRNFSPSHINFTPLQKIFLLRNNRSNEGSEGGKGIGSIELFATSTWLIFEIRRWREERLLVRKGNMCKIIRNCSRRCRLNPISPVSISSHRAGYSPFRRITLPPPPPPPSSLGLTFTPLHPPLFHLRSPTQ